MSDDTWCTSACQLRFACLTEGVAMGLEVGESPTPPPAPSPLPPGAQILNAFEHGDPLQLGWGFCHISSGGGSE